MNKQRKIEKSKRISLKKKERMAVAVELDISEQTVFQSLAYKNPKSELGLQVRRLAFEKHNPEVVIEMRRPMQEDDI